MFAAAELAPWQELLKKTIGRFPGQFSLVLATDGFVDPQNVSVWQRLFLKKEVIGRENYEPASCRRDLLKLLTDLGQLVESTLVVDRKTGLSFDQSLRRV